MTPRKKAQTEPAAPAPASPEENTELATQQTGLLALEAAVDQYEPEDTEGYVETPEPLMYATIRQKQLLGPGGKTITDPKTGEVLYVVGAIRYGAAKEPACPDDLELRGVILGSADVRSFFPNVNATEPDCGSSNMVRAEPWGFTFDADGEIRDKEGRTLKFAKGDPMICEVCPRNRFGSAWDKNDKVVCKNNIQFFMWIPTRGEVVCFTVTPGGRRAWSDFRSRCLREFRRLFAIRNAGKEPPREFPWIQFEVVIGTEYLERQGGYYVPTFALGAHVSSDDLMMLRVQRKEMAARMEATKKAAAAGLGFTGEDVLGGEKPAGATAEEEEAIGRATQAFGGKVIDVEEVDQFPPGEDPLETPPEEQRRPKLPPLKPKGPKLPFEE